MKLNKTIIAVDFDGTVVRHKYPEVGEDVANAVETLRALVASGSKLILFTMRSGEKLADAVAWFDSKSIELYGIQSNPTQRNWTESPKAYAQLYIDDAALGCPLIHDGDGSRAYVDWRSVRNYLEEENILKKQRTTFSG